eukprot:CAMPEP_0116904326 /NCGR_PEP_ID=MMETSP0467-20121206/11350_1 /TAXON_ID=283647 /ORGANISM="Mesodinium pulex, Strain SPMC105" /LENGTH=35 /DNA_ID= /DNA_START= /DNA_END= /DNA_ORIENTATION=
MLTPEYVRNIHDSKVDQFFNGHTQISWDSITGVNR